MADVAEISAVESAPVRGGFMAALHKEMPTVSLAGTAPKEPDGKTPDPKTTPDYTEPVVPDASNPVTAPDKGESGKQPVSDSDTDNDAEKWPRSSKDWDTFKTNRAKERADYKAKIAELTAERDAIRTKVSSPTPVTEAEEYKAIAKERDELSQRLRLVEVTKHPQFEQYFSKKTSDQIALAEKLVGPDLAGKAKEVLSLPEGAYKDEQLEQLISSLPTVAGSRLAAVLNNLAAIESEKQEAINNEKTNFDTLQAKRKAENEASQAKIKGQIESGIKSLMDPKDGNPAFQMRDNDEAWNKEAASRTQSVRDMFDGKLKPERMFQIVSNGIAFDAVVKQAEGLMAQIDTLTAQVKKLTAATPTSESRQKESGDGTSTQRTAPKAEARPHDRVAAWAKNLPPIGVQQ